MLEEGIAVICGEVWQRRLMHLKGQAIKLSEFPLGWLKFALLLLPLDCIHCIFNKQFTRGIRQCNENWQRCVV